MKMDAFDWRRGKGWFRVWVSLALLWYLVAGLLLVRMDFSRGLTWEGQEFSSEREMLVYAATIKRGAAAVCATETLEIEMGPHRTHGSPQLDYEATQQEYTLRLQAEEKLRNPNFNFSPSQRTFPPLRTVYRAEAWCNDRHEVARITLAGVAALLAPFALVLLIAASFYLTWFGFYGGRRLFVWIAAGFKTSPEDSRNEEQIATRRPFAPDFWDGMKPALVAVGTALVAVWIAFSLSTGVRADATEEALGKAVGSVLVLLFFGVSVLILRHIRRPR